MVALPRRPRTPRGAAVVEFALIAVLLIALVLGIISYGYMLAFRQGISQGAAEGARAAAVAVSVADQKPDAVEAVNEALKSYGVTCDGSTDQLMRAGDPAGTCSVSIGPCENNAAQSCAKVHLDYAYRDNALVPSFPGVGLFLPASLDYTSTARVS